MADKVKTYFRLLKLYALMDLKWFTQDTKLCLIVVASEWISSLSSILGIFLLAARFSGIGGMSADEVLWMLGFLSLGNGTLCMFFGSFNVHQISRRVGRGQVDHMLIQPIPLWMQLATEGFMPVSGSYQLVSGILITAIASARLGLAVTPLWLMQLILMVLAHVGIQMGLSFFAAASAFYKPVACEEISSIVSDLMLTLARYPLSGMPVWLIELLITAVPAGLLAWLPSMILLHKVPAGPMTFLPITVAAVAIALASYFFRKGLKTYAKTGSQRYRDMGFRN